MESRTDKSPGPAGHIQSTPTRLSLKALFEARKAEVEFLALTPLQSREDQPRRGPPKRAHQLVARNLRRRAASHNPYKVRASRDLRLRAKQEIDNSKNETRATETAAEDDDEHVTPANKGKQKRRQYRREKRRDHVTALHRADVAWSQTRDMRAVDLLWLWQCIGQHGVKHCTALLTARAIPESVYRSVNVQVSRVQTHFWYSKRCMMTLASSLWSLIDTCHLECSVFNHNIPADLVPTATYQTWKVPFSRHDKGSRSVYRADMTGVTLFDTSYEHVIRLTCAEVAPLEKIFSLLVHVSTTKNNHRSAGQGYIYKRKSDYPYGAVAPVSYIWQHGLGEHVLLLITPRVTCQLVDHVVNTAVKECQHVTMEIAQDLFMFELTGPHAGQALVNALTLVDDAEQLQHVLRSRPGLVPHGTALGLKSRDPRLAFLAQSRADTPIDPHALVETLTNLDNIAQHHPVSLSPRVTGVNVATDTLNSKKNSGDIAWLHELFLASTVELNLVRLVADGWLVIGPRDYAFHFWHALIHCGHARVIDWLQRNSIRQSRDLGASFPCHAVDTTAYWGYAVQALVDRAGTWAAKPASKRQNFAKLGIDSPFMIDWSRLTPRGWIFREHTQHEHVWSLVTAHSELFRSSPGGLIPVWVTGAKTRWGCEIYAKSQLIGYVTTDQQIDLHTGHVTGLGFVSADHLLTLDSTECQFEVRNIDSPQHVQSAKLSVCHVLV